MPAPTTIVHYTSSGCGVYPYDPEFYARTGTSAGQYYYKWGPIYAYNSVDATYELTTQYIFWIDNGDGTGSWYVGPTLANIGDAIYQGNTQSTGATPNTASWTAINTGTGSGPTLSPVSYADFVAWKSGSPEVDGIYTDSGSTYNSAVYFRRKGGGNAYVYWDGYSDWVFSTSLGGVQYYVGSTYDPSQPPQNAYYMAYSGNSPAPSFGTVPDFSTMPPLIVSGADDGNFNGVYALNGGIYNEYPYWQRTSGPYTLSIFRGTTGAWTMAYNLDTAVTRIYFLPNSVILPTGTWLPDDGASNPTVEFDTTTTISIIDGNGTAGVNCDYTTLAAWWNAVKNNWTADYHAAVKGGYVGSVDMRPGFVNAQPSASKYCRIYNYLTDGYLGNYIPDGNYPISGYIKLNVCPYMKIQGLQFWPDGGIEVDGDVSTDNVLTGSIGEQEGLLIENCLFFGVTVHVTSHLSNITFRRNVAIAQTDTPFFYYFCAMSPTSTQELWNPGWDTIPQWTIRYWNNSTLGGAGGGGGDGCASFAFQQSQSNGVSYDIMEIKNNVVIKHESGPLLANGGLGNTRQINNFWAAASKSGLVGPTSSDTGDVVNSPASGWAYPISTVTSNIYTYGPDFLTPVVDAYWTGDLRLTETSPALGLGADVSSEYTTNALNLPIVGNDPGALPRYTAPTWSTPDLTSGLRVYLKCNDGSGTSVANTAPVSSPHAGTLYSFSANPWATGGPVWNNCVKGDTSGFLRVLDDDFSGHYDQWTVSAWVKKVSTDMTVWSASGLGNLVTSGNVYAGIASTHQSNNWGGTFGTTADGNWHLVTLVKSRTANSNWGSSKLSFYLDAVLQADHPWDSVRQYFVGDGGGGAWGGGKQFDLLTGSDCYIQEFRAYSRPLSLNDIYGLYALAGGITPTPTNTWFIFL